MNVFGFARFLMGGACFGGGQNGTPTLRNLTLTPTTLTEGEASSIAIGRATAGSTLTVQSGALPDGMTLNSALRTITGTPTVVNGFTFTLREALTGATNTPHDTSGLAITVQAVAPTLAALSLSSSTASQDTPKTINILGATVGSTITVHAGALPAGMTLDSATRTIAGTPTDVETTSFTLREVLAGATNTPRDTSGLGIDVSAVTVPTQLTAPTVTGNTTQTGNLGVTSGTYTTGSIVTTLIRAGTTESVPYAKDADDAEFTFWARDTVTVGATYYIFDSAPLTVASSIVPPSPPDIITTDFATATTGQTLVDLGWTFNNIGNAAAANTYKVHSDGVLYLDAFVGGSGNSSTSLFTRVGTTNNTKFIVTNHLNASPDTFTSERSLYLSMSADNSKYFRAIFTCSTGKLVLNYNIGAGEVNLYFHNSTPIATGDTFAAYINRANNTVYLEINGVVVPPASGGTGDGGWDVSAIAVPATAKVGMLQFGATEGSVTPPYPVANEFQVYSYYMSSDIQISSQSYDPTADEIDYALLNVVTQAQVAALEVSNPDYPVLASGYANISPSGTFAADVPGSFRYLYRDTANPGAVVESDQVNVFGIRETRVGMNAGTYAGVEYYNQQFSIYADRMNFATWSGPSNEGLHPTGPGYMTCFDKHNRLVSWPGGTFVRINVGWCIHPDDEGAYEWLTGGVYTLANYDPTGVAANSWRIDNPGAAAVSVGGSPGPNGGPVITIGAINGEPWFLHLTGLPAPMTVNTLRLVGEADPTATVTQGWVDAKAIYNGDTRWMQWPVEGFANWTGVLSPSVPNMQWIGERGYSETQWLGNFPNWADRFHAGKFVPEYAIETANRSGSAYYANLPWVVTDDWLHGYGALLRDTLDPAVDRVPFELQNEPWNGGAADQIWLFYLGYCAGYNGDTASRTPRTVVAQDAVASVFTASIASAVLTVTGSPTGVIYGYQYVDIAGLPAGTLILPYGTGGTSGTGGAGTYALYGPQGRDITGITLSSRSMQSWNPSNERVTGIYSAGTLLFRSLYGTSYKNCIFEAKRTTTNMDLPTAGTVGSENDDWLCVATDWQNDSVAGKEDLGNGPVGQWRYWGVQSQRICNILKQYIEPGRLSAVLGGWAIWTVGYQLNLDPATDPVYNAFTFPAVDGGEGLIDVMDGYVEFNDAPYLPNIQVCSMTTGIATLAPGAARQAGMASVFTATWDAQKDGSFAAIWAKRPYLANLAATPRTVNGVSKSYSPARIGKGYYEGGQQFRTFDLTGDITGGTGGVSSATLTVTAVNSGTLAAYDNGSGVAFAPGQYLFTVDGSGNKTPLNVYITAHPSGSVGGPGTYTLSSAVTLANGTHLAVGNDDQFLFDGNMNLRSVGIEAAVTEFLEYCWRYGGAGSLFDEGTPAPTHTTQQYGWTWFDSIPSNYVTPTPGTSAALVNFLDGL